MNKERIKGFVLGLTAAALVSGVTVSALAASRTIPISDNIRLTINDASFTPLDVNGKVVETFTYNGTTYAPVRAICEAAGLTVTYDANTQTAQITLPNASADYIDEAAAKKAATDHAGVTGAAFTKCKLEWDDERAVYDLKFSADGVQYKYEIDALTRAVREYDSSKGNGNGNGHQGENHPEGYITAQQAKAIALKRVPEATITSCEFDYDDNVAVYEIEMRSGRTEYECDINAVTGDILSWDVDQDD